MAHLDIDAKYPHNGGMDRTGGVNAITTFHAPTRHVGNQPYCATTGQAVWKRRATKIAPAAARQMIAAFAASYAESGLNDHATTTYDDDGAHVVVTGARDAWNIIGIGANGTGIHAVARCACHANEIAQYLAKIA